MKRLRHISRKRPVHMFALTVLAVFVFALMFGNGTSGIAGQSPEVAFTDASASGLNIVPASCASSPPNPHVVGECDGTTTPSCPDNAPYSETNPASIANYCAANGVTCAPNQHYVSSISCNAAPGWKNYGPSCTAPSCGGCGCIDNPVTSCPDNAPYVETNPASIANYCSAQGVVCSAPQTYVSSISCNAAPGWNNYGPACTSPSCGGCGCIDPVTTCPDGTPAPGGDLTRCTRTAQPAFNLEVNGSDNPPTVRPGETFYFTWTTRDVSSCTAYMVSGTDDWWSNGAGISIGGSLPLRYGDSATYQTTGLPHTLTVNGTYTYAARCQTAITAAPFWHHALGITPANAATLYDSVPVTVTIGCPAGYANIGGSCVPVGPTCPDGSPIVNGTCPGGGGGCTDPRNCPAPTGNTPACNMVASPSSAAAGSPVTLGWASACNSATAGCTTSILGLAIPAFAGNTTINQGVGAVNPTSGVTPLTLTPSALPVTYTLTGQLYTGYWPLVVPVAGSAYSCSFTVQPQIVLCPDGSAAPGGDITRCTVSCVLSGYPRCKDASTVEYLNALCQVRTRVCPYASSGYGCVSGACRTPPAPSASFNISPKLMRSGEKATISWNIGPETSCSISASNSDNSAGLTGTGSKQTASIIGETRYTLNCVESITGEVLPPQTITVGVVPIFREI